MHPSVTLFLGFFLASGDGLHRLEPGLLRPFDRFKVGHCCEPGHAVFERPGVEGSEVIIRLADTDKLQSFELLDSVLYGTAGTVEFELKPPVVAVAGLEARPPDKREESLILTVKDFRGEGPDPGWHAVVFVDLGHGSILSAKKNFYLGLTYRSADR